MRWWHRWECWWIAYGERCLVSNWRPRDAMQVLSSLIYHDDLPLLPVIRYGRPWVFSLAFCLSVSSTDWCSLPWTGRDPYRLFLSCDDWWVRQFLVMTWCEAAEVSLTSVLCLAFARWSCRACRLPPVASVARTVSIHYFSILLTAFHRIRASSCIIGRQYWVGLSTGQIGFHVLDLLVVVFDYLVVHLVTLRGFPHDSAALEVLNCGFDASSACLDVILLVARADGFMCVMF